MEALLTELTERLKNAAGANLKSVVLYGSAATGEFQSGHSDLNVLCIIASSGSDELEALHDPCEWWVRKGHPTPRIFTLDELHRSADIFSIELLDIKERHRVVFGDDVFADFEIPLHLHRLQVERELRIAWLRLREAILLAPPKKNAHLAIMTASISSFCVLFRHAVIAAGHPPPASKRDAIEAMAKFAGADPSAFRAILDLKEGKGGKSGLDVEVTLHAYLEFVQVAANEVDRTFEGGTR
jgi:predicted nucleotidyltransferase